ncbi:MAG TPA: FeoA family protein [Steroidobacteraceae bacterium]|nr:FeoA family protein [Steroidobacteraceae bacterium]
MTTLALTDRAVSTGTQLESPQAALAGRPERLSALPVGARTTVLEVGARPGNGPESALTPLERRLLELGFIPGEQVEVLAEARPGRDPFVVRVGSLTLALRRREADTIWVGGPAEEP